MVVVVVVYDSSTTSSQCGRDVEGSEDKGATSTSNSTYIIEVDGQDKGKKVRYLVSISDVGGGGRPFPNLDS